MDWEYLSQIEVINLTRVDDYTFPFLHITINGIKSKRVHMLHFLVSNVNIFYMIQNSVVHLNRSCIKWFLIKVYLVNPCLFSNSLQVNILND